MFPTKKLFTFLMIMALAVVAMAQAPEKFSYQAVVRDASGNLVSNSPVGVRVSILKNSASGVSVYCETHHLNTNTNGLLTMEIGGGTLVGGDFASIQWGDGPYFLKMETDVTGGSNYTISATQQLLSVPYALYAKYAENGGFGSDTTGMGSVLARLAQLEQQVQNLTAMIGGGDTGTDGQSCPGAATVTDVDNNTYNTVQIGTQCWMKENLRTTRYANGTSIALGSSTSSTTAYRYYPDNNSSNVSTYGYLYNWKALMGNSSSSSANPSGVQGICPTGWHVPSDAEWTQLTDYVSGQSQYVCGVSNSLIAKALASTTGWQSSSQICAVGNNPSFNNTTGFSALPAGGYFGYYLNFGDDAYFWSATEYDYGNAYYSAFSYNDANVNRHYSNKYYGFSVRCVRD
ncbi:MAG: fibrobacter succinogenes major paralogous domain-containing protein [Bacteroidales bacterium]|nr:fibrobacter succinogenes major paralogous domain-containing protein [Bacteroidales bacterium]